MAEKANIVGQDVKSKLELLTDEKKGNAFVGRSNSSFKKWD